MKNGNDNHNALKVVDRQWVYEFEKLNNEVYLWRQ